MFLSPKLQPEWKRQLANLKEPRAANIVYVRRVVLSPHTRSAVFPAFSRRAEARLRESTG